MAVDRTLLVLTCPACSQRMKAPVAAKGKTYKCVKCGEHVKVEAPNIEMPEGDAPAGPKGKRAHEPIGQLLLKEGLVNQLQLDEAFAVQDKDGGKTFEILIELGHLDKDDLHALLSRQPGTATIQLDRVQIDREVLQLVPRALALEHKVLPIDRLGKLLTVAMACPLDAATIAEMESQTGLKVKAMLCRLDAIHLAVEKYYPEEGGERPAMATFELPPGYGDDAPQDLSNKIGKLEHLIVSPDFVERLNTLAQDSASKPQDIALTASADPALAAALLRTANSAAYGLPRQVDSVSMALTMLGREGTSEVVTACGNGFAKNKIDLAPLYERARRASISAAAIAKASGQVGRSIAHSAGLLHELGRIALASAAPEKYARVDLQESGQAVCAAEKKAVGFTHPEAAALLALRWHLPNVLCDALQHYLDPGHAQESKELAAVLCLAAAAAGAGSAVSADTFSDHGTALNIVGLSADAVAQAVRAALGE